MRYFFVVLSVIFSVLAQVLVKEAAYYEFGSKRWIVFVFASVGAYGLAFLLQTYIMRLFPISKIAPAMAIAIMLSVFFCGLFFFNEQISLKQLFGVLLGSVSIYLILF